MAAATQQTKPTGYSDKQTVRIMTVDKDRSRIECAMRDGAMVYVAVWETPIVFRWPKPGEIWTIRKDSGIWRLDAIVQSQLAENISSSISLSDLPEGGVRILGEPVYIDGKLIVAAAEAPADDDIPDQAVAIWFDPTDGAAKIRIKARQTNGTIVNGSISLS